MMRTLFTMTLLFFLGAAFASHTRDVGHADVSGFAVLVLVLTVVVVVLAGILMAVQRPRSRPVRPLPQHDNWDPFDRQWDLDVHPLDADGTATQTFLDLLDSYERGQR